MMILKVARGAVRLTGGGLARASPSASAGVLRAARPRALGSQSERRFRAAQSEAAAQESTASKFAYADASWELRMLYDGDCPLCMREVNMLKRRDEGQNKIDFVDIASPAYEPLDNQNISFEKAMNNIHAITREGEVVTNIEVFRRLYDLVGLGWVFAITKTEPFGTIIDKIYDVWAHYRLPITGREDLEVILAKRKDASMCK